MSRTIKTDQPPLKMTVEAGRLAPASAYDAERLDTYRRGSTLNVFITHEKQRVDEKKWWAAINRAVKECSTPWKKSAQASEAIKLALGIVDYSKTIGGEYMQYPKSLTELDDSDLADAVRGLFDVLYGVTGVDPEDWKKQVEHIRDEEPSSETSLPDGEAAVDAPPNDQTVAADPAPQAEAGAGDREERAEPSSSPAPEYSRAACISKLMAIAIDKSLSVSERAETLGGAADIWCGELGKEVVKTIYDTAKKVLRGELQEPAARKYLETL